MRICQKGGEKQSYKYYKKNQTINNENFSFIPL